jgi:hypothetical protein
LGSDAGQVLAGIKAKKVKDAQEADAKKAALGKLEEKLATAVADAAHKLPPPTTHEKNGKSTAPTLGKTQVVLKANRSEKLWSTCKGRRKCGSELHMAEDRGGDRRAKIKTRSAARSAAKTTTGRTHAGTSSAPSAEETTGQPTARSLRKPSRDQAPRRRSRKRIKHLTVTSILWLL